MLSVRKLEQMNDWEIFATGTFTDNEYGVLVWNSGYKMDWVAVRGRGYHDWAIYYAPQFKGWGTQRISDEGDKLTSLSDAARLVHCDEDSLKLYRRR